MILLLEKMSVNNFYSSIITIIPLLLFKIASRLSLGAGMAPFKMHVIHHHLLGRHLPVVPFCEGMIAGGVLV